MRFGDASELDAWILVHQRAAAATDLHVDESWGDEPAAAGLTPYAERPRIDGERDLASVRPACCRPL